MARDINYAPIYGVEPYKNLGDDPLTDFGGGATITAENLMISLWNITHTDSTTHLPDAGDLIKPTYVTLEADHAAEDAAGLFNYFKAYKPFVPSRTSARFNIVLAEDEGGLVPLVVLNPPSEFKTRYISAIKAVLDGSTSTGLSLTFSQSCLDALVWNVDFVGSAGGTIEGQAVFGSPAISALPFLKTSGVDGVFPEFYTSYADAVTNNKQAQFVADMAEIVKGNFYIPCLISPDDADIQVWTARINWPHSAARGG